MKFKKFVVIELSRWQSSDVRVIQVSLIVFMCYAQCFIIVLKLK